MNFLGGSDDKNVCKRIFPVHDATLCVRCTDQRDSTVAEPAGAIMGSYY